MPIRTAEDLLARELNDIRDAESQAVDALEGMREAAEDDELADLIERRLDEGGRILRAVEESLGSLDGPDAKGRRNDAARALIAETEKLLAEIETPQMKQAAMIAGAQKLEHYCIAAWGTARALASELGQEDLAEEMERAVEEGYRWDEEMSALAEGRINPEAIETDPNLEEED